MSFNETWHSTFGCDGPFTVPEADIKTETDTENKYTEPNCILCVVICLCAMWTTPHNPIQPIFYLFRYRFRCREVKGVDFLKKQSDRKVDVFPIILLLIIIETEIFEKAVNNFDAKKSAC